MAKMPQFSGMSVGQRAGKLVPSNWNPRARGPQHSVTLYVGAPALDARCTHSPLACRESGLFFGYCLSRGSARSGVSNHSGALSACGRFSGRFTPESSGRCALLVLGPLSL